MHHGRTGASAEWMWSLIVYILLLYMSAKRGQGGRTSIKEKANCERKVRRRFVSSWVGEIAVSLFDLAFAAWTDASLHPKWAQVGPSHLKEKLWWSIGIHCLSGSRPHGGSDEIMAKMNKAFFTRRPTYVDGHHQQAELSEYFRVTSFLPVDDSIFSPGVQLFHWRPLRGIWVSLKGKDCFREAD